MLTLRYMFFWALYIYNYNNLIYLHILFMLYIYIYIYFYCFIYIYICIDASFFVSEMTFTLYTLFLKHLYSNI